MAQFGVFNDKFLCKYASQYPIPFRNVNHLESRLYPFNTHSNRKKILVCMVHIHPNRIRKTLYKCTRSNKWLIINIKPQKN